MLQLSFKQTQAEIMVRAAATVLFNALSKSCAMVKLSELAESPQYGLTASASDKPIGAKFVRITDLKDGGINWETVPFCQCENPERYALEPNDILFARTGATTGKTHLVQEANNAVFASYLIRLRPKKDISAHYLYSFFQSDLYWSQILEEKQGSAQPNVNAKKLVNVHLPIAGIEVQKAISNFLEVVRRRQDGSSESLPELPAPIAEQRRIVARIEELATKIEEARGLRESAIGQVDRLTDSVIYQIFSKPPQNWESNHLSDYILDDCYGTSEKTNNDSSGVAILRMGNIQNGKLVFDDLKYLFLDPMTQEKLLLQKGDILVNRTNSAELVGKCAVFDNDGEYAFASYIIRLRPNLDKVNPYLLSWYINSSLGRSYMFNERKQMTGQANVNAKKIKAMPICMPGLSEQNELASYIDGVQSESNRVGKIRENTFKEFDALLPAILDKAFKGEL